MMLWWFWVFVRVGGMNIDGELFRDLADGYRVSGGEGFSLGDFDAGDLGGLDEGCKDEGKEVMREIQKDVVEMQEKLYAEEEWSLLLIFQAMDAAGKDSTIEHVMTGVNPAGCQVSSFGVPGPEEMKHGFLWRCVRKLPEKGRIGIFNRSYYEEVLVVRVNPGILAGQKLSDELKGEDIWEGRFEDIRNFERYSRRNGTKVVKFFLNVSKEEQRKRFRKRLDRPDKHWKFNVGDLKAREQWDEYQRCYEEMIRNTATEDAPWYVVPADHKWFMRTVVMAAVADALEEIGPDFPKLSGKDLEGLEEGRTWLEGTEG